MNFKFPTPTNITPYSITSITISKNKNIVPTFNKKNVIWSRDDLSFAFKETFTTQKI